MKVKVNKKSVSLRFDSEEEMKAFAYALGSLRDDKPFAHLLCRERDNIDELISGIFTYT